MIGSGGNDDEPSLKSERASLKLAHWPPPMRAKDRAKDDESSHPKRQLKENIQLAHRRGTRLTRSLFTDLSDDD